MEVDSDELSSNCRERLIILLLRSFPLFPSFAPFQSFMCVRAFYWTRETRKLPELSTGQETRPLPTIPSTVETATVFGVISTFREQTRALTFALLDVFLKLFRRRTKSLIIQKRNVVSYERRT